MPTIVYFTDETIGTIVCNDRRGRNDWPPKQPEQSIVMIVVVVTIGKHDRDHYNRYNQLTS